MLKQFVRAFALGLLVASGVFAVTYYMDAPSTAMDEAAMKEELTKNGYYIYDENMNSTIIDLQTQIEMLENEMVELKHSEEKDTTQLPTDSTAGDDETTQGPDDATTDVTDTVLISIVAGMQVPEVAQLLIDNQIIEDQNAFITYLEQSERSRYIQVGDFELHSNMSIEEIVATITGG